MLLGWYYNIGLIIKHKSDIKYRLNIKYKFEDDNVLK